MLGDPLSHTLTLAKEHIQQYLTIKKRLPAQGGDDLLKELTQLLSGGSVSESLRQRGAQVGYLTPVRAKQRRRTLLHRCSGTNFRGLLNC